MRLAYVSIRRQADTIRLDSGGRCVTVFFLTCVCMCVYTHARAHKHTHTHTHTHHTHTLQVDEDDKTEALQLQVFDSSGEGELFKSEGGDPGSSPAASHQSGMRP